MTVTNVRYAEDFPYTMTTDVRGRNTYAVQWIVDTDDQMMSPLDVANQAQLTNTIPPYDNPLPAFWATYSFQGTTDIYAYFKGGLRLSKPYPDTKKTMWTIEGVYEPLEPGDSGGGSGAEPPDQSPANPVLRAPVYHTEVTPYSRLLEEDNAGNPIVNSAGVEFDVVPNEQGFWDVLVITRNYATLTEVLALQNTYRYSVNSDIFLGAAIRTAKIDAIPSGPLITEGAYSFYRVAIRVTFNYETWDRKILSTGFTEIEPFSGKLIPVMLDVKDSDDVVVGAKQTPTAVKLNEVGVAYDDQKDPTNHWFVEFKCRREVAYAGLLT